MGIHIMPPLYEKVIKPKLGRFEYYHGLGDTKGTTWLQGLYQSFTPQQTHTITKVPVLIARYSDAYPIGIAGFAIYETDVDGHPTGPHLCYAEIPWADLPHEGNLTVVDIPFDVNIKVNQGQLYSLAIWWAKDAYLGYLVMWSFGANGGNYPRGKGELHYYTLPWVDLDGDFWFEEWAT